MVSAIGQLPQINGYQLVEQLYSSPQSIVYKALQLTKQQKVIIKVLANDEPSAYELARFRNQYAITKSLSIPGIIRALSLEPYEGSQALVMEDCGGISLERYAQPLTLASVLEIAIQLADILHDLHQHRVIHKDIKPANILIHPQFKQVKLIDFSVASVLPKETQALQSPQMLEGTLSYLSPEQTGRMNRGIDYRTDYYSLGVTLYQLLTDKLPFSGDDPLELIHCHLARIPVPVSQMNSEVPGAVSAIVAKLMAKNAEDRYQSALGLKHDLVQCLSAWTRTGEISDFVLGEQDISDRFLIPEKLYGRDTEVAALLAAFERVSEGAAELMLIAGFSGIGKTAVVNEVHKPIVKRRGYFIKGKFDQFNRNIPLSAFVQALQGLIAQLLAESDEQLAYWRSQILSAVGDAGQVLIEVIPELVQIIGEQPPVPVLSGIAEQSRFNVLFQKFVGVFTSAKHPLVIFLDDLQWADTASLALTERLLKDQAHLLMLGAYRDNEVSSAHPLTLTIEAIEQQVSVQTLSLMALPLAEVNQLVAETLSYSVEAAQPLAELIYRKAKGNPFFMTQFLKVLHSEGAFSFNTSQGRWEYDITRITALTLSEDVVEFMAQQLQKLPADTQNVLKLAACVGNQFELDTLVMIAEMSATEVAQALWPALQEGLVLHTNQLYKLFQANQDKTNQDEINQDEVKSSEAKDAVKQPCVNLTYRFLHDRIQQAAASLIEEGDKQQTHLRIGLLLLKNTPVEERDSRIFDITNHLNTGMEGRKEEAIALPVALSELNLLAGKRAKKANAIATAANYFSLGLQRLPEHSWNDRYALTFDLHRRSGECAYLSGDFSGSQQLLETALQQASSDFDKAKIYAITMNLFMTQGDDFQAGIRAGLDGLALLGLTVSSEAIALQAQLATDQAQVQQRLEKLDIAQLYHHPVQSDPAQNLTMRLLVDLWALSYLDGNGDLLNMTVVQIVLASLKGGNTSLSAFGYVTYAMNLAFGQEYKTAYQLACLAQQLNEKFNRTDLVGKINNLFCNAINPYNRPLATNIELYQTSYRCCMECGDLTYGVWALFLGVWTRFDIGESLVSVNQEAERYLDAVVQIGDVNMHRAYWVLQRVVQHLSAEADRVEEDTAQSETLSKRDQGRWSLDDETLKEAECLARWQENNFEHGINWYHYLKAQLLYTYEQYGAALQIFRAVEDKVAANVGFFPVTKYYFYYLLVLTALYPDATEAEREVYWPVIEQHYAQLQVWADSCPENFRHQALIAAAEMARVCDRDYERTAETIDLYEAAIAAATESQFVHHEALANELAAKFYLSWGKERCAVGYLQVAYAAYARWGAAAKTTDLEIRYSGLLVSVLPIRGEAVTTQAQTVPQQTTLQQVSLHRAASRTAGSSLHGSSLHSSSLHSSSSSSMQSAAFASSSSVMTHLDLAAVLKASQSLSGEIELDRLLATVLHTALETSGADRGILLMPQAKAWFVEAVATVDRAPQVYSTALSAFTEIPQSVIRTVKRELKPMVVDYAATHSTLAYDAYICRQAVKSLLCAPIMRRGQLVALLYLENRVTVGAFTRDRVETLQMLAAQAAISITNARLYQQVEQYSQTLEAEVEQQTLALRQKAMDLEQTLIDLKETQAKLIQSEKMSALGQMVGGIAHEINNPITFIHGNLKHAKEYVSDLLELVSVYQQEYSQENVAVQEAMEDINFSFVEEDSLRLFDSMRKGTERISQIVLDLRNFSRLDEAELKPVDLHSGLESALGILKHRLEGDHSLIQVEQSYDELPLVTCYASQLNQVFLNLLSNAFDALKGENAEVLPKILISTQRLENDFVRVRIADNGCGVADEIKERMFEPFFTTKPVGAGTGLGLSVSYAIVKQHGGTIRCVSEEGVGTEMIVELPLWR